MTFVQRLRPTFGSQGRVARPSRRGKSRQEGRTRYEPRLLCLEDRLVQTTLLVNSLLDNTTARDGLVTLREAIAAANTGATTDLGQTSNGNDTIQFAPGIDGGAIKLSTVGDRTAGPSALAISANRRLVIDGNTGLTRGITIERGSATPFRLFYIAPRSDLTLQSVTLRGGLAKGGAGGGGFGAGAGGAAGLGGAIFNAGLLTIQNSTLAGNTAQGGAGGTGQNGPVGFGGGGLTDDGDTSGRLPENGSNGGGPNGGAGGDFFSFNGLQGGFGGGGGGGAKASHLGVILGKGRGGAGGFGAGGGSGASGNFATNGEAGGNGGFGGGGGAGGGGKYNGPGGSGGFGGGNSVGTQGGGGAGLGGAIYNQAGAVSISNSTITGNKANGGGGGYNPSAGQRGHAGQGLGGGLFNHNGTVQVSVSTISLNTADQGGRGIYSRDDSSTVAAVVRVNNSIIAQADHTVADFTATGDGVTSGSGNLIGRQSGFAGSFITGNPRLHPLQHNGGPTPTLALAADSPAINRGTGPNLPYLDQRGYKRQPALGYVDIGAYQFYAMQTIYFGDLHARSFGDADFAIRASASSNLPVRFTASSNLKIYQDAGGVWYAHITGAGTGTIMAHQDGDDSYEPASAVTRHFRIARPHQ